MQKKFDHKGIQFTARTNMTGNLIEVGIFTVENTRPFHLQLTADAFSDLSLKGDGEGTTLNQLVDFVIEDFIRLIDVGLMKI